jgi:hypothetical protein
MANLKEGQLVFYVSKHLDNNGAIGIITSATRVEIFWTDNMEYSIDNPRWIINKDNVGAILKY